jgi:hypothetical protein
MAMTSGVYGVLLRDKFDATLLNVDLVSDGLKMSLHTDGFTANFDAHDTYGDLDSEVDNSGGYTTGGAAMSGTTSVAIASGSWKFDHDTWTQWTSVTITAAEGRVIYDTDSTPANHLILATDFGSPYSVSSGTLTVDEHANGIWTIDYTP